MFGLTYMMPKTGNTTATEKAIDSSENDSSLKSWALDFQDFVNLLLDTTLDYTGQEMTDKGIGINTEFRSFLMDLEPKYILEAAKAKILPNEVVFEEFKRRGIIKDEWDWAEVLLMLEQQEQSSVSLGSLSGGIFDQG